MSHRDWEVRSFAPGRTELAGNHTDHQGGKTISAAVDRGISMFGKRTDSGLIELKSDGFDAVGISLCDLSPVPHDRGTTASLVRGVAQGLAQAGVELSGCKLEAHSDIACGGGLSSSAAFELAVAHALVALFTDDAIEPMDLARIAMRAEREHFGKPCGLQDQAAIACGGISLFDFASPLHPSVTPIDFDFSEHGYAVCLVDTGCDHSACIDEFSTLVADMERVSSLFDVNILGKIDPGTFFGDFMRVRERCGDRAALRALHYFNETALVDMRADALVQGDIDAYLAATRRSGASSAQYLGNVTVPGLEQPALVALALCDVALEGKGALRVHGGGFGGSVQAYVPLSHLETFTQHVESLLGSGSCMQVEVGCPGAHAVRLV